MLVKRASCKCSAWNATIPECATVHSTYKGAGYVAVRVADTQEQPRDNGNGDENGRDTRRGSLGRGRDSRPLQQERADCQGLLLDCSTISCLYPVALPLQLPAAADKFKQLQQFFFLVAFNFEPGTSPNARLSLIGVAFRIALPATVRAVRAALGCIRRSVVVITR